MSTSDSGLAAATLAKQGMEHHQRGRFQEAERAYRQALQLDPGNPQALTLLGMIAGQAGRLEDAVALFERALKRDSRNPDIHHNLGETWRHLGNHAKALECFERTATLNPAHIEAYRNGAEAALAAAAKSEAAQRWSEAAILKETAVGLLIRAGRRLLDKGEDLEAAAALRRATEIGPKIAQAWTVYAMTLLRSYPSQAAQAARRSLEIEPGNAFVWMVLGDALGSLRRDEEAQEALEAAEAAAPNHFDAFPKLSFVQFLLLYEDADQADLFARHRAWGEEAAARRRPAKPPVFKNSRDPARRLRIGYVSPDFCAHSVSRFVEPLFAAHDREGFEIACYSGLALARHDRVTAQLKTFASLWRDTAEMNDEALRRQVRADRIDILIDLAGHTNNSQIMAFAARPAPVTATWLGYPATTGLPTMDWRITDAIADPPGAEAFHTEKLMRLPGGFLCYGPPADAPAVVPPPVLAKGHVTFGSFNNQLKLNRSVFALWSRVLEAVPDSRLLIKSDLLEDEGVAARVRGGLMDEGVAAERIELRPKLRSAADHLAVYGEVDIALDPFPYNGTTTTCEALWMGVPVIALVGDRHSARVGLDLLTRVGLEHLAAPDRDGYVRTAVALAGDRAALAELRAGLRAWVAASPLCDAPRFAREFEAALRHMWQEWCADANAGAA